MRIIPFVIFMSLFSLPLITQAAGLNNKNDVRPVIGWLENVGLEDANFIMKARIDTGAGLASLNAQVMEIKRSKNGSERVVFSVQDASGRKTILERPVEKWVNIKKKGNTGFMKRPVVKLVMCLGGKKVRARVNLADRSGFLYPMLIGRNVLKAGDFMIDPQTTYTHEPPCK